MPPRYISIWKSQNTSTFAHHQKLITLIYKIQTKTEDVFQWKDYQWYPDIQKRLHPAQNPEPNTLFNITVKTDDETVISVFKICCQRLLYGKKCQLLKLWIHISGLEKDDGISIVNDMETPQFRTKQSISWDAVSVTLYQHKYGSLQPKIWSRRWYTNQFRSKFKLNIHSTG